MTSSSYLNQIFFINEAVDIDSLQKYMFTKERKQMLESIEDIIPCEKPKPYEKPCEEETSYEKPCEKPCEEETSCEKPCEKPCEEENEFIKPKHPDTLFWCLYILEHGYNDYVQIGRNYGIRELEEKKHLFEFVKANIPRMKNTNYKITNVAIQEILSELITVQKEMSMLCFISMIVKYNVNILIVNAEKTCMVEFWANKDRIPSINSVTEEGDAKTYVLYKDERGKYRLQIENISTYKIIEMQESMIVLDSYNRTLKAISNYKVNDLELMAKKLGIYNENKKYKKAELYDAIIEKIGVF